MKGSKEIREEQIPFDVRRTRDPRLLRGTEVVVRAGRPGTRRVTYVLRTVNGVRQKRGGSSPRWCRSPGPS